MSLDMSNYNISERIQEFMLEGRPVLPAVRVNGTPSLGDVLPFEPNNENYILLKYFICTIFDNIPCSSVG